MIKQNFFKHKKYYIFIFLLISFTYVNLVFSYFQQDEWHTFGGYIFKVNEYGSWQTFINSLTGHLPILHVISFTNFSLFGVQNLFSFALSFLFIFINIVLWVRNIEILSQSKMVAYGSVLFGFINFSTSQAITWTIPSMGYQLTFLFLNLSFLILLKISKDFTTKYFIYLLLCLLFIYLTRLNAYFFIVLTPFVYLFLKDGYFSKLNISLFLSLFIIGLLVVYFYLPFGEHRYVPNFLMFIFNIVYIPIKSLSHILLLDSTIIYEWSEYLSTNRFNLFESDRYHQTIVAENISAVISLLIIIFASLFFHNFDKKEKGIIKLMLFIYYFSYFGNFFDKHSTGVGLLESRYYYISAFFIGVIVFMYINLLIKKINNMTNIFSNIFLYFTYLFLAIYFLVNINIINQQLLTSNDITNHRKNILQFIKENHFNQVKNNYILYFKDINLPHAHARNRTGTMFQTGILYPLLVYVYDTGKIDYRVFGDDDLFWNINYEGYNTIDDKTMGIYYSYDKIQKEVNNKKINVNDVYCMEFDYTAISDNLRVNLFDKVTYEDCTTNFRKQLQH